MSKLKLTRQSDGTITAELEGDDINWNLAASLVASWVKEEKKAQPDITELNEPSTRPPKEPPVVTMTPDEHAIPAEQPESAEPKSITYMRTALYAPIAPKTLKTNAEAGTMYGLLRVGDEIDVPLKDGGTVTVVCAYVCDTGARFIFKDCWDEGEMDDEDVSRCSYFESKGRKHVLEDILPQIAPEWQEIMTPRLLKEDINNDRVEYLDKMWLPSATDMFGGQKDQWNDVDDSFQLPIFKQARCRVKERGGCAACSYWLRSGNADINSSFYRVYTNGSTGSVPAPAYCLGWFAPGFDVGIVNPEKSDG